jgi:hypothetical protein
MREFLSWVDRQARTYDETMAAWRTSCPRLAVWEDAVADDLVSLRSNGSLEELVELTSEGRRAVDRR